MKLMGRRIRDINSSIRASYKARNAAPFMISCFYFKDKKA